MIKLQDLPEETKFIPDDDCDDLICSSKTSMLNAKMNGWNRSRISVAKPVKQEIDEEDIEYLFQCQEDTDGYEEQAFNCMQDISKEDMQTVLRILNTALHNHIPFERGEEVDPASIDEAIKEMQK